ncbi:MAG: amino acid transporter [Isosphaeraceae bacterium]|jgi:APA family basic amino acid/polyamine antiporter|nr:MAG: amino acid transporter [Isosphaeraceae bacterium]
MTADSAATEPRAATETPLVRALGPIDAAMIVVGSMIGSGIFITSAESARLVGSPGWLLAAWALAGVLTITGALCCAELSAMMPQAGGQYVFLREAFGPPVAFLFGWSLLLVVQTGTIAAVAVAFAKFLGVFLPGVAADRFLLGPVALAPGYALSLSTQQLVAIGVIAVLTLVNTRGLETGKRIQNLFTFAKTGALLGLIVLGLGVGIRRDAAAWTSSWWNPVANGWDAAAVEPKLAGVGTALALVLLLGKAMIGPLFSQTAWNNVTFTGGEVRDPARNIPRALILGCSMVVVLYLLANLAYVLTLSLAEIQHADQDRVGTAAMARIVGPMGVGLMAALILISTFGCVNGLVLAGARVSYAMARDGLFFARAGRVNARRVPATAMLVQGLWAALLTLPLTVASDGTYGNVYSQLLEYIVPADLAFYALMVAAVIVLRIRRPDAARPFRTPLYPLPALIYLVLSILLIADLVVLTPQTCGIGALIVLAGLPIYLIWSRSTGRR